MRRVEPTPAAITPFEVTWTLAALALALAPHVTRFSPSLLLCFLALATWRLLAAYGFLPFPDRQHPSLWLLKQTLAIAAFVVIYISYQGQLGRDAGIALLSALLGLKTLEMNQERDFYVVNLLTYFVVVTNFFYSQTLLTAAYMLGVVVMVTAGFIFHNYAPARRSPQRALRRAVLMVMQSIPLMVLAFILFPRIPGPLWGIPQNASGAVTGLSGEMTIGHIAELFVSDDIAFRVEFDDQVPRARDLYWRGPVLDTTDGRTWRRAEPSDARPAEVGVSGMTYGYTVTLEPHHERWLLALDAVTRYPTSAQLTGAHELVAGKRLERRHRYRLESSVSYRRPESDQQARARALALPAGRHPETRAIAAELTHGLRDRRAKAKAVLNYFHDEGFVYTLTPPRLFGDPIDGFLRTSREGFCEHFSAAFVVLMRAAGVPARIVTGYQGGEFNQFSDYMIVRQRDAHAWAEIHLADAGWVRVDPTAAVAPERVSLGIDRLAPARGAAALLEGSPGLASTWQQLRHLWDAGGYAWSRWVLAYNPERQRNLLDALGLWRAGFGELVIALAATIVLFVLVLTGSLRRRRVPPRDRATVTYQRFCRKLAAVGLRRNPPEGAADFAHRVARERADLGAEVMEITQLYNSLRYGNAAALDPIFARRVKLFTPTAFTQ